MLVPFAAGFLWLSRVRLQTHGSLILPTKLVLLFSLFVSASLCSSSLKVVEAGITRHVGHAPSKQRKSVDDIIYNKRQAAVIVYCAFSHCFLASVDRSKISIIIIIISIVLISHE